MQHVTLCGLIKGNHRDTNLIYFQNEGMNWYAHAANTLTQPTMQYKCSDYLYSTA